MFLQKPGIPANLYQGGPIGDIWINLGMNGQEEILVPPDNLFNGMYKGQMEVTGTFQLMER